MTWYGCGCGLGTLEGAAVDSTRTGLVRYPLRHIGDLLSKGILRKALYWSGPVAASPCKGMGQWQLTSPDIHLFKKECLLILIGHQW
jgi:hypothetical protein